MNPANETALTLAANKNSQRDIEYLVKAGARVNHTDNRGKTPMHHLARWNEEDRPGTADTIRLLSQYDANPDAQDNNGCSPLIIATRESNCQEVVRALLEAAADCTLVDREGKTPLHVRDKTILRITERHRVARSKDTKTQGRRESRTADMTKNQRGVVCESVKREREE